MRVVFELVCDFCKKTYPLSDYPPLHQDDKYLECSCGGQIVSRTGKVKMIVTQKLYCIKDIFTIMGKDTLFNNKILFKNIHNNKLILKRHYSKDIEFDSATILPNKSSELDKIEVDEWEWIDKDTIDDKTDFLDKLDMILEHREGEI